MLLCVAACHSIPFKWCPNKSLLSPTLCLNGGARMAELWRQGGSC
jgi:hypothetical protein